MPATRTGRARSLGPPALYARRLVVGGPVGAGHAGSCHTRRSPSRGTGRARRQRRLVRRLWPVGCALALGQGGKTKEALTRARRQRRLVGRRAVGLRVGVKFKVARTPLSISYEEPRMK
jgi:hypothetical protein